MNFVLVGKAKQIFKILKLAAERSPELSRTCPFNPKSRCNVPIAEPCSSCKVWQEAREKEHEEKMNEAANIEDYWKHLGNED